MVKSTPKKSDVQIVSDAIVSKLNIAPENPKSHWKALRISGIEGQGQVLQTPKRDKIMLSYGLRGGKFATVYGIDLDELRRKASAKKAAAVEMGNDNGAKYWDGVVQKLDSEPTKSKMNSLGAAIHLIPGVQTTTGGDI